MFNEVIIYSGNTKLSVASWFLPSSHYKLISCIHTQICTKTYINMHVFALSRLYSNYCNLVVALSVIIIKLYNHVDGTIPYIECMQAWCTCNFILLHRCWFRKNCCGSRTKLARIKLRKEPDLLNNYYYQFWKKKNRFEWFSSSLWEILLL